jgi:hypothetical protein
MNYKKVLLNIGILIAIVAFLVFGSMFFLDVYTRHGETLVVPDFTNMSTAEAERLAEEAGVRIDVVDSLYVKRMSKGHVYRQTPQPGSRVKQDRRILLTINAMTSKKVDMPNLVGFSMRQASAELQSRGLTLGRLIYKTDMATDNVLAQRCNGENIPAGKKIETGTVIDLVVGLNPSDNMTMVPDLIGLKCLPATDAVHSNSLNAKAVYDSSVKDYSDSLMAVVYSQSPSAEVRSYKGSQVTMFLTIDSEKYSKENADGATE